MIGGTFSNIQFKTFYVSKEVSACPLISEIIRIGKKFDEIKLYDNIWETIISLRYGKRILINSEARNIGKIKQEDFIEIIDYDPIKNIALSIGPKQPRVETPIHWLIHHARHEINAIIQINNSKLAERFEKKLPNTKKDYPIGTLDQAKDILGNLQNSKKISIKNQGLIFVGNNLKEVENLVLKTLEEMK